MRTLLAVTVLTLGLTAQEAAPLLEVELAGPAAWRQRLRPTNLGTMLSSAEAEAVWGPWAERLRQLGGMLGGDAGELSAQWLDYSGAIQIRLWARAEKDRSEPWFAGTVVVGADGASDHAALASRTVRLIAEASGLAFDPQPVAESDVALARRGEWMLTAPRHGEGGSMVWFGNDTENLRRLLAEVPAPPAPVAARAEHPVLSARLDLAQSERLRRASGGPPNEELTAMGFPTLRDLELSLRARGPQLQGEVALTFAPGDRGLFSGLFPARAGVPELFGVVPPEARAWKVGRFDLPVLWRAVARAQYEPKTVEQTFAEVKNETGVDLEKEIFAQLTDEVMVSWHPRPDAEKLGARDLAVCAAMRLRDEAVFKPAFARLLRASEFGEIQEAGGVLRADQAESWLFPALHLAVGGGFVILALGERGGERIDAVLAQLGRKEARPEDFELLGRAAPEGWNSVGVLDLHALLHHHLGLLFAGLREAVADGVSAPDSAELERLARLLLPLLQKHHLDRVTTLTGTVPAAWRFRILW